MVRLFHKENGEKLASVEQLIYRPFGISDALPYNQLSFICNNTLFSQLTYGLPVLSHVSPGNANSLDSSDSPNKT